MNLSKKLIVAAIALPLFAGSAFADGGRGDKDRHGGHEGRGSCMGGAAMFHNLNLSDEQKAELKQIREAHHEARKAQFEQHKDVMAEKHAAKKAQKRALLEADSFDQKAAQAFADDAAKMLASMTVKKLENEFQMISVLTPEQKTKYFDLQEEGKQDCRQGKKGQGKKGMDGKGHERKDHSDKLEG